MAKVSLFCERILRVESIFATHALCPMLTKILATVYKLHSKSCYIDSNLSGAIVPENLSRLFYRFNFAIFNVRPIHKYYSVIACWSIRGITILTSRLILCPNWEDCGCWMQWQSQFFAWHIWKSFSHTLKTTSLMQYSNLNESSAQA